ncbi:hypothetical protein Bbelb_302610 [Branchiostoma belcheri]|nr:hypothetical protein Bbelb_302610 [Branchiostoma belcheri]
MKLATIRSTDSANPPSIGGINGTNPPSLWGINGSNPPSLGGINDTNAPSLGGINGTSPPSLGGIKERVCEHDHMRLSCAPDKLLVIHDGFVGRRYKNPPLCGCVNQSCDNCEKNQAER